METFVIAATVAGSFVGALLLQRAALAGLFRLMRERRTRE
jgi:hypothetical protein